MHALIVLAHPEEKSFNAQLARTAKGTLEGQGHTVEIADLYREGFDPLEGPRHFPERADSGFFSAMAEQRHAADTNALPTDVEREIARLERADLVIFQFPLWWWSVPAILKGWLDRVFVWGRVYSSRMRYEDRGHFRGKRAFLSVTTGAPEPAFGPDGRAGNLDLVLWPVEFSLSYVGFSVLPSFRAFGVGGAAPAEAATLARGIESRKAALSAHLGRLDRLRPLPFNGSQDWDETGRLKPDAPSHSPFIRHAERPRDRITGEQA